MTVIHETSPVENPRISVISFCLNGAPFLHDTMESVSRQSCREYEHIIVDGGSTDTTTDILQEYPHVRWISEKETSDNPTLEAIWKGVEMARGDYVIFLAISDGIVDRHWFRRCVALLDSDREVAFVWGLAQGMSEEGNLKAITKAEYLEILTPPQKRDFFAFWLATRHGVESTACFRRNVFKTCFPSNHPDEPYRFQSTHGLNYHLNTMGYLPYFIPTVSYFGRTHSNQRQELFPELLDSVSKRYSSDFDTYRKNFLSGKIIHHFRDGRGQIIGEIRPEELGTIRRKIRNYHFKNKVRRDIQKLLNHIKY